MYPRALSIAGFDGSGGAGIQADLKVFTALGCYGMSVLTSLPIQNTHGVQKIYPLPTQCVQDQLESILNDIGADVIKIGMLERKEIIKAIAQAIPGQIPVVLDPVLCSKNGTALLDPNAIKFMKSALFPLTTLLTPNLDEAECLLGKSIRTKKMMEWAAVELTKMGPKAVVIKGGHLPHKECLDCLYAEGNIHWFTSERIASKNTHGTGCVFSSSAAAYMSKGNTLIQATELAKSFTLNCIKKGSSHPIGQGNGPLIVSLL